MKVIFTHAIPQTSHIDVYVFVPLGLRYQVILEDDFNVNNKVLVQYKMGLEIFP